MNDSETPITQPRRSALSRGAAVAFAGIVASSAFIAAPALASGPAAGTNALGSSIAASGSSIAASVSSIATSSLPFGQVIDLASVTYTTAISRRVLGRDGRFTILLLGSDARPSHPGLRTDTIIVASVDPVTRRAAAVSIPRDTVNFPLSSTRRYSGKVNALYQSLARTTRTPGTALRKIVGTALGIEIDAYALVGFAGFRKLVNNVRGLDVYVAKAFYDRTYSIRRGRYGFGLSRGWHHLVDLRALAFARTRHADNDYARARRQQQLIVAAIGKVKKRGLPGLVGLLAASRGLIKTDLPLAYAPLIFAMVTRADLARAHKTVFGPSTFAMAVGGYNNVLRIAVCRAWIRRYFPPVHSNGAWLPPAPAPTPVVPIASP